MFHGEGDTNGRRDGGQGGMEAPRSFKLGFARVGCERQ